MNIQDKIVSSVKKMEGFIVGIGIHNERVKEAVYNNSKITGCDMLENIGKDTKGSSSTQKSKMVSIYKLRKKYKKEKVNTILCNVDEMDTYMKYFLRDGFYICRDTLYIFGKKNMVELEELKKRLQRYKMKMEYEEDREAYVIVIHKQKEKIFLGYFYFYVDTIMEWLDKVGDVLGQ